MASTNAIGERVYHDVVRARGVVEELGSEERADSLDMHFGPVPPTANRDPVLYAAYTAELLAGALEIIEGQAARITEQGTRLTEQAAQIQALDARLDALENPPAA